MVQKSSLGCLLEEWDGVVTQWVTWLTVVRWGGLARPRGPLSKPPWADEHVGLLPGLF